MQTQHRDQRLRRASSSPRVSRNHSSSMPSHARARARVSHSPRRARAPPLVSPGSGASSAGAPPCVLWLLCSRLRLLSRPLRRLRLSAYTRLLFLLARVHPGLRGLPLEQHVLLGRVRVLFHLLRRAVPVFSAPAFTANARDKWSPGEMMRDSAFLPSSTATAVVNTSGGSPGRTRTSRATQSARAGTLGPASARRVRALGGKSRGAHEDRPGDDYGSAHGDGREGEGMHASREERARAGGDRAGKEGANGSGMESGRMRRGRRAPTAGRQYAPLAGAARARARVARDRLYAAADGVALPAARGGRPPLARASARALAVVPAPSNVSLPPSPVLAHRPTRLCKRTLGPVLVHRERELRLRRRPCVHPYPRLLDVSMHPRRCCARVRMRHRGPYICSSARHRLPAARRIACVSARAPFARVPAPPNVSLPLSPALA
ncbi:hypothetical protein C8R44DRAFT_382885 [Mycena epipterygia]|nr:hypothetical protein C8R44DRAFT_382885 [Mycena epipterygia]